MNIISYLIILFKDSVFAEAQTVILRSSGTSLHTPRINNKMKDVRLYIKCSAVEKRFKQSPAVQV